MSLTGDSSGTATNTVRPLRRGDSLSVGHEQVDAVGVAVGVQDLSPVLHHPTVVGNHGVAPIGCGEHLVHITTLTFAVSVVHVHLHVHAVTRDLVLLEHGLRVVPDHGEAEPTELVGRHPLVERTFQHGVPLLHVPHLTHTGSLLLVQCLHGRDAVAQQQPTGIANELHYLILLVVYTYRVHVYSWAHVHRTHMYPQYTLPSEHVLHGEYDQVGVGHQVQPVLQCHVEIIEGHTEQPHVVDVAHVVHHHFTIHMHTW
jgi:hypothetical protein